MYYKKYSKRRYQKVKVLSYIDKVAKRKINNKLISFLRWIYVDTLRGKTRRKFGIYLYVAMCGQGKTLSMCAHIERYRKSTKGKCYIATNFHYKYEDESISHWSDMVRISKECYKKNIPCLIAMDEIHITFDSADWHNFPPEILAMLSFNRKYGLEFLCSSQVYERIPAKIRNISNYTVICKNYGNFDRYFKNYYFSKDDYESQFEGKKAKAKFIRSFVADDELYGLYNTLEQVDKMVADVKEEKSKKQEAFELLFGDVRGEGERNAGVAPSGHTASHSPEQRTVSKK